MSNHPIKTNNNIENDKNIEELITKLFERDEDLRNDSSMTFKEVNKTKETIRRQPNERYPVQAIFFYDGRIVYQKV